MPTKSYRDDLLKRLEDSEYADLYLETVLEDALEDGYMDALPSALKDVLEASTSADLIPSAVDDARESLYQAIKDKRPLTREFVLSEIRKVGLDLKMRLPEAQLLS